MIRCEAHTRFPDPRMTRTVRQTRNLHLSPSHQDPQETKEEIGFRKQQATTNGKIHNDPTTGDHQEHLPVETINFIYICL
ncbi:hypothetical protein AVEN_144522-1 [Araneus ventricosus]|uniref:Uncharacterized protein n=1 Tax=Araneus ventricosus TaxID=182803 RepID=A0A4Y2W2J2_ARAVE|nr:hypothetical protein AVEN_144522-1 [Araneus ventricosus]